MKKVLLVLLIATLVSWLGIRMFAWIQFERNCDGYLKNAAVANSVPLAKQELEKALEYIEKAGLTSGYTSAFYNTPNDDIGFWYNKLKAAQEELNQVNPNASQLEKNKALINLQKAILESPRPGVDDAAPRGISIYPYNLLMALFGAMICILAIVTARMYKIL